MSNQDMGTSIETNHPAPDTATPTVSNLSKKEVRKVARLDDSFKTIAWALQRHVSLDPTEPFKQELNVYRNLLTTPEERLTPLPFTDSEGVYHTGSLAGTKEETVGQYEKRVNSTADLLVAGSFRMDATELDQVLKEDGQPHDAVESEIRETRDKFKAISGKQRVAIAKNVAQRVDAGLARHGAKYLALWATLKLEAGQTSQRSRLKNFDVLPEDKQVQAVKGVLPELDALTSGRFDGAIKVLEELLRERGDGELEIGERILILKSGQEHASRSQRVEIVHKTEDLAAEILLTQFPLYLGAIRELGDTETELDAADALETDFHSSVDGKYKAGIATSARQRVKIKLGSKFEEHYRQVRNLVAEENGISVPSSDVEDRSILILRALKEEWTTSSLQEQLDFIRGQKEEAELLKD